MQMPPSVSRSERSPKMPLVGAWLADERGAVAIEYALIASMTAVIAIAGLILFGDSATGLWAWVSGELTEAMSGD